MTRIPKRLIELGGAAAFVLLAVFVVASVVSAARTVYAGAGYDVAPPPAPVAPSLPARPIATTFDGLSGSPVFGALVETVPVAKPEPIVPPVEDLRKSTLNLRLVGAVAGPPDQSFAIIEDKTARTQRTYSVGDEVTDTATLDAIHVQRVVLLRRNGEREALDMLEEAVAAPLGASRGTRVATSVRATPGLGHGRGQMPPGEPPAPTETAAVRRINDNLRVINREQFQQEMPDLVDAIRGVYTEPRMVGGQASGVTMKDLGRGDAFSTLGFEAGDVVVSVNGQRINSDQDLALLAESMATATDIRVQIIRNNLPRTLIYKVR